MKSPNNFVGLAGIWMVSCVAGEIAIFTAVSAAIGIAVAVTACVLIHSVNGFYRDLV